jgi:hypothetical protein
MKITEIVQVPGHRRMSPDMAQGDTPSANPTSGAILLIGIFLERYIVMFWRRALASDFPLVLFTSALT